MAQRDARDFLLRMVVLWVVVKVRAWISPPHASSSFSLPSLPPHPPQGQLIPSLLIEIWTEEGGAHARVAAEPSAAPRDDERTRVATRRSSPARRLSAFAP